MPRKPKAPRVRHVRPPLQRPQAVTKQPRTREPLAPARAKPCEGCGADGEPCILESQRGGSREVIACQTCQDRMNRLPGRRMRPA